MQAFEKKGKLQLPVKHVLLRFITAPFVLLVGRLYKNIVRLKSLSAFHFSFLHVLKRFAGLKIYALLLLFGGLLSFNAKGQTNVNVGSGASSTASTTFVTNNIALAPRGYRIQAVYTPAELTAAGWVAGNGYVISQIGIKYKTNAAPQALNNYTIRMGHTALDFNTDVPVAGLTTVKNAFTYTTPTAPADPTYDMITLDANFTWNGTSSICIDVCYTTSATTTRPTMYAFSGGIRSVNATASQCAVATNSASSGTVKPQVRLVFSSGAACSAPNTQALNIVTTPAGTSASINWTNGNGGGRVVYVNTTNSFTAPTDGTNPTANLTYTSGQQCVFNGTGSGAITVTGLTASTQYFVRVYEYCTPTRNYITTTGTNNPNSFTTTAACTAPNGTVAFSAFSGVSSTATTTNVTYTNGGNVATGYVLLRNSTNTAPTAPASGTAVPSAGSTSFVSGYTVVGTSTTLGSSQAFNSTGLTASTTYYYWVVAYQNTNGPCWFTPTTQANNSQATSAPPPSYCTTSLQSPACSYGYIDNISVSNLNQTATGCSTGYTDYTGTTVNFTQGANYSFTITSAYNINDGFGWWIDYNDNGSFSDAGEFLGNFAASNTGTTTSSISISGTATVGNHRMRVRGAYFITWTSTNCCTTGTYGETHDYTASIAAPCTAPTSQATIGTYTNNVSPGTSLTVNWSRGTPSPGNGVVVVARLTATSNVDPTSGTTYTANTAFGSGTGSAITGTGNFVVYVGTGTTANITGLTGGTSYTFTVYEYNTTSTCYKTPGSSSVVTTFTPPTYCTTGLYSSGCASGDNIGNVSTTLGSTNITNNGSGCSAGSYSLHSATSLTTTVGGSFTLNAQTGGSLGQGFGVWIDYNQDGTFDATEFVYASPVNTTLNSTTITVPGTALTGTTRMRVRCNWNSAITSGQACTQFTYGETEDYTVNIGAAAACTAPNGTVSFGAFSGVTSSATTTNVTYTNGGNTATGYALLRNSSNAAPTAPASGTAVPTAGSTSFVSGYTVVNTTTTIGSSVAFNSTGLSASTTYYYWVVAYQSANGPCWFTPVTQANNSQATSVACVAPATPATPTGSQTGVCSGSQYTYSVTAVAGATSYDWTLPPGWTAASTNTASNSITATAGSSGYIRVRANNCGGSSAYSSNLGISVTTSPTVSFPEGQTVYTGCRVLITPSPSNASISASGGVGISSSGGITYLLGTSVTASSIQASNGGCLSPVYTITVTAGITNRGTLASGDQAICDGQTPNSITYSAAATGTGITYQWYYKTSSVDCPATNDASTGWTIISGAQSNSYSPAQGFVPAGSTYTFACYVGSSLGSCGGWSSGCRKITVSANNTAGAASSTQTVVKNSTLTSITHTTTGATGISESGVSGANTLPAGVSASWSSNLITISGTPTSAGTFTYSIPLTGGCGSVNATGTITVVDAYTWNGSTSIYWSDAANWTPNGVPTAANNVNISGSPANELEELSSLTINANTTFTLQSNAKLTLSGSITNNGTLTIESGATLVQTGSGANANTGSGTYNVKQYVTGSGTTSPNGRFWYLGSPLSNASSSALLSNNNLLWQWNEGSFGYSSVTSGNLTQGRSYVLRSGQNETLNFSGTGLSNGTVTVPNLTRSVTPHQFRGCHLVSNPYPSYLNWDMVGKTYVSTTMYIRTASASSIDVLETYNSANFQGTSISGPALTKYIAPMQGFWVKVETDGQTGSLSMDNSMRSHQSSGVLRSTPQDFPAYLRFNMIDGLNKDQVILLMSPDASMSLDNFDSEKMSASGYAQFYSTVNAKKLVINGMKNVKAKTSVPLTLVMPTSKSYMFQAEEFNIEDGLILLEDKQEDVIQDLTINPTYSFFGNAGTNATRFVVHFQLASAPILVGGPQELESLGSEDLTTDNIQIISNNQGTVIIRLDEGFKPEGKIRVFDASGRLLEEIDFNDQETTIQLNGQAGMYFVEVSAGKLMVKKKIVIN